MALKRRMLLLAKWAEGVGVVGLWLMLGTTLWDVVGAKVFKAPLSGAIELVSLAQLLAVGAGMAMTLMLRRHIQVEFLQARLPSPFRRGIGVLSGLFIAAFLALMAQYTWRYAQMLSQTGEMLPGLRQPLHPFAYAFAALLAFNAFYGLYLCLEALRNKERR